MMDYPPGFVRIPVHVLVKSGHSFDWKVEIRRNGSCQNGSYQNGLNRMLMTVQRNAGMI